jgi:hypothetical protein
VTTCGRGAVAADRFAAEFNAQSGITELLAKFRLGCVLSQPAREVPQERKPR